MPQRLCPETGLTEVEVGTTLLIQSRTHGKGHQEFKVALVSVLH